MTEDLREQYATDDNLRARIALHAAFSINPHWAEWLFDRETPGRPGTRILDVGCGPGTLWRANGKRIDATWSLTLADLSPGMIEVAPTGAQRTRGLSGGGRAGTAFLGRFPLT